MLKRTTSDCLWFVNAYNKLLHIPLHAHVRQIRHHVGDYFEAGVLWKVEGLGYSSHRVASGRNTCTKRQLNHGAWREEKRKKTLMYPSHTPSNLLLSHCVCFLIYIRPCHRPVTHWPVGVAGHVFVHTLDSYLQPGAAVGQHVAEVALQAVVRPRLDGDPHTLGVTALRVPAWRKLSRSFLLIICVYLLSYNIILALI